MQKNNHTIKKGFVRLLGNERYQAVSIPLFAIVLSLLAGAVVILALGKNPLVAYQNLLQGSGILPKATYAGHKSMLTDFMSFMNAWTPMLFASLAVAVALRAGLFNIGVSGQMLVAGFVTEFVSKVPLKEFGEDYEMVIVGPPPMMKFTGLEAVKCGAKEEKIWVSFERKMSCAVGKCGHCRIDEVYVCLDGPVFNYTQAKNLID